MRPTFAKPRLPQAAAAYIRPMHYYPLEIVLDGKRRRGDWTLLMGGRICVRAPGCKTRTVDLDGADPHVMAPAVLREMLEELQADPGRFLEPPHAGHRGQM